LPKSPAFYAVFLLPPNLREGLGFSLFAYRAADGIASLYRILIVTQWPAALVKRRSCSITKYRCRSSRRVRQAPAQTHHLVARNGASALALDTPYTILMTITFSVLPRPAAEQSRDSGEAKAQIRCRPSCRGCRSCRARWSTPTSPYRCGESEAAGRRMDR